MDNFCREDVIGRVRIQRSLESGGRECARTDRQIYECVANKSESTWQDKDTAGLARGQTLRGLLVVCAFVMPCLLWGESGACACISISF